MPLTFILFAAALVVTAAADTYTTHRILQRGGVELNTLLYGAHPSLARLVLVDAVSFVVAFVVGIVGLHFGDVFTSVVLFGFFSAAHLVGAIHNALQP